MSGRSSASCDVQNYLMLNFLHTGCLAAWDFPRHSLVDKYLYMQDVDLQDGFSPGYLG